MVNITPSAAALLDRERSNKSTPSQESKAQLSGPPMPGVQINEEGNFTLIMSKASTNMP